MEKRCGTVCLPAALLVFIGLSLFTVPAVANGLGSAKPTLVEDKFSLPMDHQIVTQDWVSRGFTKPVVKVYTRGWARDEHAYPRSLLITALSGRMEFVIADHRVVVEPGDELYYPARAVMLARNIHDGDTSLLISQRK